ncbi:DUF1853 family protein [Marinobacter sp. SS21]|uniref:DUF1853 family protein n=1 Tax=Marinobacter sp. SS21 TaxID=2979460 RepID=UPI00232C3DD7|nr:DUF1853 family protein [Marinobacter sp. SS21]MDC0663787.1 DUF1853 family protein [Marinobacter sp. SS21]
MRLDNDHFWHTPAVRHLAWLCRAPTLIRRGPVFHVGNWLPAKTPERLKRLDLAPEPLLSHLDSSQSHRLGHYFEQLYHFLLADLLGWPVLLRNHAIRNDQGRTLGELDFLVRNPHTGGLEHHEIAVKFYLSHDDGNSLLWYGPNARDRLDLKTDRMLEHQCTMTERPETLRQLQEHGFREPVAPALVMLGNLFAQPGASPPTLPGWINPAHDFGYWLHHSQLKDYDTSQWTPLHKPHWLGAYQSRQAPDRRRTKEALAAIAAQLRPTLFARMQPRHDGLGYEEVSRWFVVPDSWPGLP